MLLRYTLTGLALGVAVLVSGCCSTCHHRPAQPVAVGTAPIGAPCPSCQGGVVPAPPVPVQPLPATGAFGPTSGPVPYR
jgi:hypothetical protein